jgi:hypothetical protein
MREITLQHIKTIAAAAAAANAGAYWLCIASHFRLLAGNRSTMSSANCASRARVDQGHGNLESSELYEL